MDKEIKRLGIYHSKDLDGYLSGAVLKYRFHDIKLMGWDYSDPLPNLLDLDKYDEVIMIDITFPLEYLIELSRGVKLTIIDHHVSFKRSVDDHLSTEGNQIDFEYIYDPTKSACEIGSLHYLNYISPVFKIVGDYDTWRNNGTVEWDIETTPLKYYLYGKISNPHEVDIKYFNQFYYPEKEIEHGITIRNYTTKMNSVKTKSFSHVKMAYGLRALCLNINTFSSEVMESRFDPDEHDIMVGYCFTGEKWSVSLRSIKGGVDVSEIAKQRGGGGHMCASGFEVNTFEEVFR